MHLWVVGGSGPAGLIPAIIDRDLLYHKICIIFSAMAMSDPGLTSVADGLWVRDVPAGLMVFGDLDIVSEQAFRRAVSARANGAALLLDMTQLNFLDSRGLAALFGLAEDPAVDFWVRVRARSLVDRVVEISGLAQVVRIERVAA